MKNLSFKKLVFIVICVLGLISFSACRSSSQACGLADHQTTNQTQLKQVDVL